MRRRPAAYLHSKSEPDVTPNAVQHGCSSCLWWSSPTCWSPLGKTGQLQTGSKHPKQLRICTCCSCIFSSPALSADIPKPVAHPSGAHRAPEFSSVIQEGCGDTLSRILHGWQKDCYFRFPVGQRRTHTSAPVLLKTVSNALQPCNLSRAFLCYNRKGEAEQEPLKTKQATNLRSSTFTGMAQQHHYESLSQHF